MTSGEKKREVCVEYEGGGRRGTISDGRFVCPRQAHRALVQRGWQVRLEAVGWSLEQPRGVI